MKKRNLLILLLLISVISYIFLFKDNTDKMNNTLYNNSTNLQLNKSVDKNITLNNTDNNSNDIDENLRNEHYNPSSSDNNQGNNKKDSNDSYDEALMAKKTVENSVALDKHEIVGYPVYKDSDGSWLVPIFDKYTKLFTGSVYVYTSHQGSFFVHGPESYSEYKKVISGKYDDKSDSSKHARKDKSNPVKEEIPDYSERYVLASVNPEVMTNHLISNNPKELPFENSQIFDLNQEYSTEKNNNEKI